MLKKYMTGKGVQNLTTETSKFLLYTLNSYEKTFIADFNKSLWVLDWYIDDYFYNFYDNYTLKDRNAISKEDKLFCLVDINGAFQFNEYRQKTAWNNLFFDFCKKYKKSEFISDYYPYNGLLGVVFL